MKIDTSKLRALVKSIGLPNTKVADRAGITRQALQSMLRASQVVEVRENTIRGLIRALQLPDESFLSPDSLAGYKEAVADEHADLVFRGLGLPVTEPRPMDELFVPVRMVRVLEREHDHDCQLPPTEDEPIESLTVIQSLALHRRILIQGEPGCGKTTALRHAARAYAQGPVVEGRFPSQSRVPLMVRLADFAKARERDGDLNLVRFVATRTLRDATPEIWAQVEKHLEEELERGGCLVLLDGLDEVGGDKRFSSVLRKFIARFGRNQFILTSRIVGLDARPWQRLDFSSFQVSRWTEDEIREFVRRWYAARPVSHGKQQRKQQEQRAEELTTAILSHRPLSAIASNPLMLTILAALHYANATLPRRRVDLYAKIVEVMLETWEASKREARPGDPLHGLVLEGREFGWLLERLALGMQRESRVLRPRWRVSELVQDFLRQEMALTGDQVKEQGERIISYLCQRAGLLVERGDGMFGFCHRTFQEYFAARGLLLEAESGGDIITLLHPYLFHPQWEEVAVHVAASLSAPRATALMRTMLDDPDPAGRFLRRGQLLALRCLVDGATVSDRRVLDQVFSDGLTIGGSRWLGVAIRFVTLLNQLFGARHEADAGRMLQEIEEGARQALPMSDYISFYGCTHGLPNGPADAVPGEVYRQRLGKRPVDLISTAWEKRLDDPEAWYAEVLKAVRDPKTAIRRRIALISLLGEEADSNEEARGVLEELLLHDRAPQVRTECAEALEEAVTINSNTMKLLLSRLLKDRSDEVRARCAASLRHVASKQPEVRERLKELFTSGSESVRAGAAEGLSQLDFNSSEGKSLLDQFLMTIRSSVESPSLRCACLWTISSLLRKDDMTATDQVVISCLDDPDPKVSWVALHILADAMAEGRREWPPALVEKVEAMLMAVPDPCPHLFGDLTVIVASKEMRGRKRMERILGDAILPLADRVRIAFVFGSVARIEQVQESDIDLMVIGEVRLKELSPALHIAEQTLGRPVNPVVNSPDKFRAQYREGNPFLQDIVRKEKLFLKGTRDELTELVADRSPD